MKRSGLAGAWFVALLTACSGGTRAPVPEARDAATEAMSSPAFPADGATRLDSGARPVDVVDAAAEASAPDATAAGDSPPGDIPICEESAVRCAARASAEREICRRGRFEAFTPCPDGQVCDSRASVEPGACALVETACTGAGDAYLCLGETLIDCTEDGVAASESSCASQNHCQQGLARGECAECIVGRHRCRGAALQRCGEQGTWTDSQTCDSAALCNANAGSCTDQVCVPDAYACAGDTLRRCDGAGAASSTVEVCGAGLCDAPAGACDVCAAGAVDCADASTVRTCNAQGDGFATTACEAATPYCVGAGQCVQCRADEDCPGDEVCAAGTCAECATAADCPQPQAPMSDECAFAACGSGECRFTYSPGNSACGPNDSLLCSGSGWCGECNPWTPCPGTDVCFEAYCVECFAHYHCGAGRSCLANHTCG